MVLLDDHANSYISGVAKTEFIAFRVAPELKRELQRIADDEQRALSQVCEMFLYEGVEGSKKEGPKFMQRLVAKQKARSKTLDLGGKDVAPR
jgi:predicted transcriptional regulator